jgi:hypothetical protein
VLALGAGIFSSRLVAENPSGANAFLQPAMGWLCLHAMNHSMLCVRAVVIPAVISLLSASAALRPLVAADTPKPSVPTPEQNKACADCHHKTSPALVME